MMRLKGARIEQMDTGTGANSSCTGPSYRDSCCDGESNGGGSGRSSRREQWAARRRLALLGRVSSKFMLGSVLILLAAVPKQTGARRIADLDIPRNAQADDPTLQKAVDAYRQARTLDQQLKRSERAVERQTRQLRKELKQTKVEASVAKTKAFREEVSMDEDLLNQAESETKRDKRLVRQAESEMRGDKKFLEDAYRNHEGWRPKAARGQLSAVDEGALADIDCPSMRCEEAKAGGFLPTVCSTPDDCPRIRCMDYQEQGACKQGRICSKPASASSDCTPDHREGSWQQSKCPGMHCLHAQSHGYSPVFCTLADGEGDCPQIQCFNYADKGGCEGNPRQGFERGRVCKKPQDADVMCGKAEMAGVSPLHNIHSSKSIWSRPKIVESRMGMLILLILLSLAAGGAFILFKRYGAQFAKNKGPAPVPAYYGRL